MITFKLFNDDMQEWGEAIPGLQVPVTINDKFDESLSEATVKIHTEGTDMPIPVPEWTKARLDLDGDIRDYFVSYCHAEIIVFGRKRVWEVELSLIELVKVTQRLTMDNLCFSNDLGVTATRTLGEVVSRLNNQLFMMRKEDKENAPFKLVYDSNDEWTTSISPELFFTECTLFDALERIGQVFGGFPYLEYVSPATYRLRYRIFDDPNTAHYDLDKYSHLEEFTSTDQQANVIDSNVANMLNTNDDDSNLATFPAEDEFKGVVTEDYEVTLTGDNCFFEVSQNIAELKSLTGHFWSNDNDLEQDLNKFIVEFDAWKTLPEKVGFWDNNWNSRAKSNTVYWTYGSNRIENLSSLPTYGGISDFKLNWRFRVSYKPIVAGRIKSYRESDKPMKPLMQPINQAANIVNAGAYSSYLQGLVNRMSGEKREVTIITPSEQNLSLPKIGDWLDEQVIVEIIRVYSLNESISTYVTSKHFNRRTPFVELSTELRQWQIPADGKVTDRNLHYAEDVQVSIGDTLETDNGSLTTLGKQYLMNLPSLEGKMPKLAYVAWKNDAQIEDDADENSLNYALSSIVISPAGKSLLISWAAADNASMGSRSYDVWRAPAQPNHRAERQQFVQYDEKAKWLNCLIGDDVPTDYVFYDEYTGSGQDTNDSGSGNATNRNFEFTFPLSKKAQYLAERNGEHAVISFDHDCFYIEKDIRERILFNYQLDFVGKNGTIVYEKAVALCGLCNSMRPTGLRVFINSPKVYGVNTKLAAGTEVSAAVSYADEGWMIVLDSLQTVDNIALTDAQGNLLLATNRRLGTITQTIVRFSNQKKVWTNI